MYKPKRSHKINLEVIIDQVYITKVKDSIALKKYIKVYLKGFI